MRKISNSYLILWFAFLRLKRNIFWHRKRNIDKLLNKYKVYNIRLKFANASDTVNLRKPDVDIERFFGYFLFMNISGGNQNER